MRVCAMLVHPVPKMKMNFCNAEKLKRDQNKEFEQIQHHREDNLTYNDNIRQKNTSQSKQTIPCVRNQILAPTLPRRQCLLLLKKASLSATVTTKRRLNGNSLLSIPRASQSRRLDSKLQKTSKTFKNESKKQGCA